MFFVYVGEFSFVGEYPFPSFYRKYDKLNEKYQTKGQCTLSFNGLAVILMTDKDAYPKDSFCFVLVTQ